MKMKYGQQYDAATTVSFLSLKFNPSDWREIDTKQSLLSTVLLCLYQCTIPGLSSFVRAGWDFRDSVLFVSMWSGVDGLISSQWEQLWV